MSRSDAAAASGRAGPPAWILLDTKAVLADRRNATTASARTSTGKDIQVTFFAADPPRDSYFCLVDGRPDSPLPQLHDAPIGIVPFGGDGFVLAAVKSKRGYEEDGTYELHVFRSDRGTWASTVLELGSDVCLGPLDKVIALGGGELGWVNLRKVILAVDVLGESPKPRVIPLPKLLPTNQINLLRPMPRCAREYRDVVVCAADGWIRCVEMEHQVRRVLPEMLDVSSSDVLHDSDLPVNRTAASDCWRKESLVHVDDILANDDTGHTSSLLREMLGGEGDGGDDPALTVKDLMMDVPSLSIHGGDVVYIMSKVKDTDTKTWAVAVDMGNKTLVEVAPISVQGHGSIGTDYLSCGLSRYLKTD
uniref:DUF1618 domain-containing protein n=1 Tax=Setaria viridis TaxID=4556 RepID=A0A4U6TAF3_SETVI|nr:hypothetical protein SEVIR_9G518900v2 [Setaria viridis]